MGGLKAEGAAGVAGGLTAGIVGGLVGGILFGLLTFFAILPVNPGPVPRPTVGSRASHADRTPSPP